MARRSSGRAVVLLSLTRSPGLVEASAECVSGGVVRESGHPRAVTEAVSTRAALRRTARRRSGSVPYHPSWCCGGARQTIWLATVRSSQRCSTPARGAPPSQVAQATVAESAAGRMACAECDIRLAQRAASPRCALRGARSHNGGRGATCERPAGRACRARAHLGVVSKLKTLLFRRDTMAC